MDNDKRKWLVLTVIVMKIVMDGLDGSMLNIALPTISQNLGVTSGAVIWIVSAYSITTSTLILFFGRLGDIVGKTKFYLVGVAVYTLSSVFGGLANSLSMLVIARIVQAIGTSCTMANSQGLITMVFPQSERGRAMGIYGGAVSIGLLAGPTLGGLIIAYLPWQYMFLLKAPVTLAALLLGLRCFPKEKAPERRETMDYPGALLYAVAIVSLLYSMQGGYAAGYTSATILSGLALSLVTFSAFFAMQRKKAMPLLDLGLFKNPIFSVNVLTAFIQMFTMGFGNIIIPFYMQGVLGTPVGLAGLYMTVSPVIVLLVTPVSGILTDKIRGDALSLAGQILNFLGLMLMATLTVNSPVIVMIMYYCVISFGNALFNAPNNTHIMSNVPPDKLGIGGSASMCIRNIGMTLGVAFTTAVLYGGMSKVLGYHVTGYEPGGGQEAAFMYGMRNTFLIASGICLIGIAVTVAWIIAVNRKRRSEQQA
ncbi:MAG: MFS transporter [Clostridiales bacterium]|nr:MFS transporter [Clostridiales bacterium]